MAASFAKLSPKPKPELGGLRWFYLPIIQPSIVIHGD